MFFCISLAMALIGTVLWQQKWEKYPWTHPLRWWAELWFRVAYLGFLGMVFTFLWAVISRMP